MRVVITRPSEDAASLAEAVQARGHEAVLAPLSHIRYLTPEPPPVQPAATIFTSKNAVRAVDDAVWAPMLHSLPAYCVGAATADAARAVGFLHVVAGGGTGAQLAEHIAHTHESEEHPLLYLTGEHLAFDMAAALGARGLTVWRRIVYRNELSRSLAPAVITGLQDDTLDAMIIMSARVAAHFVHLAREAGVSEQAARLRFLCLSSAIADSLAPLRAREITIAREPTQQALLDLLGPSKTA